MSDLTKKRGELIKAVLSSIWNIGHVPRIVSDATHADVIIPESIRAKWGRELAIDLDANYPLFIEFDDVGVHATLAFQGNTFRCVFPWNRIHMVLDRDNGNYVSTGPGPEPEPAAPPPKWTPRVIQGGKKGRPS